MAGTAKAPKVRIASSAEPAGPDPAASGSSVGNDEPTGSFGTTSADVRADAPDVETGSYEASTSRPSEMQAGPIRSISQWLTRHFPGHEHTAIGAFCGLLVALLVFAIGVLRALFIVVLVVGGAAIGQFFDGDPRIIEFVRHVVSELRR